MAWIPSDSDMGSHPKTRRIARRLEVTLPTAVGFLHLFWHWCVKFAPDGHLTLSEVEDVADSIMWDKEPESFIGALCESGFASQVRDDTGVVIGFSVHNWEKHGGKYDKRKRRNADAQAAFRERNKDDNTPSSPDINNSNDHVSIASSLHKPLEERRGEENRIEESTGEESKDAFLLHAENLSIESPVAMAIRRLCKKGLSLSPNDTKRLQTVLAGLSKENVSIEQVEEFGRKCVGHWIGRDRITKQPAPPGLMQVLECWHEVLALPEPTERASIKSTEELHALQAKYVKSERGALQ